MRDGATCDTSVLLPALVGWHPDHAASRHIVRRSVTTLMAHVLVETYSVLTRLPAPHRLAARDAGELLDSLTFPTVTLSAGRHLAMLTTLGASGIRGGAVYDGLVAATAAEHDLHLHTRDRRARATYDVLGTAYSLA